MQGAGGASAPALMRNAAQGMKLLPAVQGVAQPEYAF
jgi:hypothetical protein